METSNEHFHAADIDTQIEQTLEQTHSDEPHAQLVADLQRLYQVDALADRQSLDYAWQHIHIHSRSQRSQTREGKIIPMYIPSSHTSDKTQGRPRQRRFASLQRTFALIAAVLVAALLVGNLLVMLSRAHIAQSGNTNVTQSTQIIRAMLLKCMIVVLWVYSGRPMASALSWWGMKYISGMP